MDHFVLTQRLGETSSASENGQDLQIFLRDRINSWNHYDDRGNCASFVKAQVLQPPS